MKILDKRGQKDYYDYLQNTYGIDDLVVYDRRESFAIDPSKIYINFYCDRWFKKEKLYDDVKRKLIRYYSSNSVLKKNNMENFKYSDKTLEGIVMQFMLEVGYMHYYFEVERYIDDNGNIALNHTMYDKERVEKDKRVGDAPMSLIPLTRMWRGTAKVTENNLRDIMPNPILKDTYIVKYISANDIWNNLYEYISSLRDKEFVDSRTDEQHIESNGFDKKISFRHRKC